MRTSQNEKKESDASRADSLEAMVRWPIHRGATDTSMSRSCINEVRDRKRRLKKHHTWSADSNITSLPSASGPLRGLIVDSTRRGIVHSDEPVLTPLSSPRVANNKSLASIFLRVIPNQLHGMVDIQNSMAVASSE